MNRTKETKRMKVRRVERESDRKLLYGADPGYHLIAKRDENVKVGDTVQYEPYGVNFGWFIKRITVRPSSKAVR